VLAVTGVTVTPVTLPLMACLAFRRKCMGG
jgi:hypothetical protein